ncbi:MAG: AAA family ATPase [Deferribacteraceae bacterium]|jgi:aminoglycoside phosphotransferase family enzyme/predicted kinase|nr:AAA family ATPase [Deferribacteraceae bacterium]
MQEIEILKGIVGDGTVAETHASAVLITSEYVYKIKKPVNFGFLDYTQMKQRRAFSILEMELNSRYCDGIYIGVLKLAKRSERYELLPLESSIPATEYVLQMKRIPDDQFLSNIINDGDMTDAEMQWIGTQIGEKLALAERSAEIVEEMNSYEAISFNARENFQQIKAAAPDLVNDQLHYIERVTEQFLVNEKDLFERRYNEGFVKDGHGDLRLEHVFIKDDKLGIIDCIEFNKRFRTNDVVAEAAFLSMELDYFNKIDLSDSFLKGFFKVYPDKDSYKVLNYYRCYRAVTRAKIAIFTMLGFDKADPMYTHKANEYRRMIDMATAYAMAMVETKPLAFCGMIATGKSVNAALFTQKFPAVYVNSDIVRKEIAGIPITQNAVAPFEEGIYTLEMNARVYAQLGKIAADNSKIGRLTIVDAAFRKKEDRDSFIEQSGITPTYIYFTALDDVIIARLKAREAQNIVTDGRLLHFENVKKTSQFEQDHCIDTTKNDGDNIEEIVQLLTK